MNDKNSIKQTNLSEKPENKKNQLDNKALALEKLPMRLSHCWQCVWQWTGLREKKGWDILQLLFLPLLLAYGVNYLQEDRTHQESLNKYFDAMTDLLLESKLRTSDSNPDVRNIARARTLTVLRGLDKDRKGELLRFLNEVELINSDNVIVNLSNADFSNADLSKAYLVGVYLSGVYLSGVYLSGANLMKADLSGANLSGANLSGANLSNADLSEGKISGVYVKREPKLMKTDLRRADLSSAKVSETQLGQAKLCNTTLPDGTVSNRDCGK